MYNNFGYLRNKNITASPVIIAEINKYIIKPIENAGFLFNINIKNIPKKFYNELIKHLNNDDIDQIYYIIHRLLLPDYLQPLELIEDEQPIETRLNTIIENGINAVKKEENKRNAIKRHKMVRNTLKNTFPNNIANKIAEFNTGVTRKNYNRRNKTRKNKRKY